MAKTSVVVAGRTPGGDNGPVARSRLPENETVYSDPPMQIAPQYQPQPPGMRHRPQYQHAAAIRAAAVAIPAAAAARITASRLTASAITSQPNTAQQPYSGQPVYRPWHGV